MRRWRWRNSRIAWIAAIERGLIVDADPDQLLRVLLNLARNAVQALETRAPNDPARDQVRITGRREGAVVVIEVSDTGPGFPAQGARASVRGLPVDRAQRRHGPRPRHRRRAGPRPWWRHQAGGGHHWRNLPAHHPGPRGRARRPPQRAGAGLSPPIRPDLPIRLEIDSSSRVPCACARDFPRGTDAPVAQLDRALDYESRGQEFESLRARQISTT